MTADEQTAYEISGLFLFMARMFGPCHTVSIGSVVPRTRLRLVAKQGVLL